ncbi:class I SAM-dependent methyltransferase [Opitutales bacterium]|nr:class I SAM-dependent methyltransferase [Opitutales bacterium]
MKEIIQIKSCRICESQDLIEVVNLGTQALTGVFPKNETEDIISGPLAILWCRQCNLLQLKHRYPPEEMYGDNYGYRSGLNQSMVNHLAQKASLLSTLTNLSERDAVLDIGSNDGTLLSAYKSIGPHRVGIDPTGNKFEKYYENSIELIPDFFSYEKVGSRKFKIITSISMFYDLDDPRLFVEEIKRSLQKEGVWHFEQSYMPSMIRQTSYDTICHEHIEYYSLTPIADLLKAVGLKILDVKMNAVNGGSFAVTACHSDSKRSIKCDIIDWLLDREKKSGYSTPWPYREFERKVFEHRESLVNLIQKINNQGKTIHVYGASTKGNVLLQFCDLSRDDIPYAAEINPDKFGRVTPGSNIPIISADESRKMKPDYYLVLPWHFREGIVAKEQEFLASGGNLIFPLPEIEVI